MFKNYYIDIHCLRSSDQIIVTLIFHSFHFDFIFPIGFDHF